MNWLQLILVIRKIVQILIDSGILDGLDSDKMAEVKAFAECGPDPAVMKGWSFAEIIEIVQKLLPVLQEIWDIIQRDEN